MLRRSSQEIATLFQAALEHKQRLTLMQVVNKETRQSSRIASLPASNVSLVQDDAFLVGCHLNRHVYAAGGP